MGSFYKRLFRWETWFNGKGFLPDPFPKLFGPCMIAVLPKRVGYFSGDLFTGKMFFVESGQ